MRQEEFDVFVARYEEFRRSMLDELAAFLRLPDDDDIELDRWADDGGRA